MTTDQTATDAEPTVEPYEEVVDHDLRQQLGLRPIAYSDALEDRRDGHPDQRPCPSWCWVGQQGDLGHEIEWRHPHEAMHSMEARPAVALSLYPADPPRGTGSRYTIMSTIEPRLQQRGQRAPTINVALRTYEGREQRYVDDFLRLSIDDAEDLIAALQYLVRTAEQ